MRRQRFVVASCRVQNAFENGRIRVRTRSRSSGEALLEQPDKFRTTFGTSFIRGLQTGGEFHIIMQVTSTSQETQNSLSVAFQAECQGLVCFCRFQGG